MNINATETNGFYGAHEITAKYISGVYIRDIEFYTQTLFDRILPSFSKLDIEADEILHNDYCYAQSEYEAEVAGEMASGWFASMTKVKQIIINLHAVGLRHLFEQQLFDLTFVGHFDSVAQRDTGNEKDKRSLADKKELRYADYEYDKKLLLKFGKINIETLKSWKTIEELKHVCNGVKHAEGRSMSILRKEYPDLIMPPWWIDPDTNKPYFPSLSPLSTKYPLKGEDIYLKEQDIKRYALAIHDFWNDFILWLLETP